LVAGAASAGAVTLVNRDDKDHKLTVIEDAGAKTTEHTLKPSQVLEGFCDKRCVIRINDNEEDEYELQPGDKVSIEEGYLYYEDPEGSPAVQPGAPGQPAAPAVPPAPEQKK
ncbi:MAG: hypothetical protein JSS20_21870, partial [Proteobacteria bacterium]|nr:hypothetical protein [Pseudomonadota bacterium]